MWLLGFELGTFERVVLPGKPSHQPEKLTSVPQWFHWGTIIFGFVLVFVLVLVLVFSRQGFSV